MPDWQDSWPEARPRWGTYSVKAHQQLDRLIPDLLMYDVLVFPAPETDAEFAEWERNRWDPGLLAKRVTQLGDHAVVLPWTAALRSQWNDRWHGLPQSVRDHPESAFSTTAAMMAEQSLTTLMGEDDDRFGRAVLEQPKVHSAFEGFEGPRRAKQEALELVAAFQTELDVAALTGARSQGQSRAAFYGEESDGERLQLQLLVPEDADEKTLHRTLDLIEDDDFQRARRRLWSWEETLPPSSDRTEMVAGMDALIADYNKAVQRQQTATRAMWVFLIVPALAGAGIDAATGGGLTATISSIGATFLFDSVKAKFPRLTGKAARASHHPGSAARGMLSIAGPAERAN